MELRLLVRRVLLASANSPSDRRGVGPELQPWRGQGAGRLLCGRECFQALQCVLNTCMLTGVSLSILDVLRPGHSLPMEHQAYSDDRRFQSDSLARVVALVTRCMDVSMAAGRVVHPSKLTFHCFRLDAAGPQLIECEVGLAGLMTTMETPVVLRVPLLAELPLTAALGQFLRALRRASASATRQRLPPLLRLRALLAYGVSSGDNLLRGLLVPDRCLAAHQVQVHKPYCRAFCLPKWTPVEFLTLALEEGGPGAPSLRDRCELLLLQSYLQSSWSRTRTRPGGRPARPGQEEQAHANTHGTRAWRPLTRKGRCRRPHETAPVHRPSPLSKDGRYGKPDASVTGSTHANHRSARSPRPTPKGRARDNPIAGPRTGTTRRAQRPCLGGGQRQAQ